MQTTRKERNKWSKRDRKQDKRQHGHRVGSKSVFVIQEIQRDRARKIARKKKGGQS
jgi:hypothetical protein